MPTHVVVVGGGVAALETAAALRALAGGEPEVTVMSRAAVVERRPLSVLAPFTGQAPSGLSLPELAERTPFTLRFGTVARVAADRHVVVLDDGEEVAYDLLVVATGAVAEPAFPGVITFRGGADADQVTEALRDARQLVFVAPSPSGWTLPVYELALLAAQKRPDASIAVVTAEPTPLWIFGREAGEAIRALFVGRGIALLSGVRAEALVDGQLQLADSEPIDADRAVALPRLRGPALAGLPHDAEGFLPVDAHGAVTGVADVYAAGDVTAFPLKQGGLSAQQADAVAAAIAARLGVPGVRPEPFRPLLRGLLLTGEEPLYLRYDGARGASQPLERGAVSSQALWWPPVKVAARHLAPLLAEPGDERTTLHDLPGFTDARPPRPENAAEMALTVARVDAERGDYAGAVRTLDSAAALSGRPLPVEWQRIRRLWDARTRWPSR
jgi:sulfide:quinone oxidoreductase